MKRIRKTKIPDCFLRISGIHFEESYAAFRYLCTGKDVSW